MDSEHDLTEYEFQAFTRLFDRTEVMLNDCIEWRGGFSANGYGAIKYKGKQRGAHQVAYELCIQEIPKGLWVLHKCDNRACINPEHLFLGDAKINKHDSMRKDRHAYGENNGAALLSNDQVREIKALLAEGTLTQEGIGRRFNVAQCTISQIKLGQTWSCIP